MAKIRIVGMDGIAYIDADFVKHMWSSSSVIPYEVPDDLLGDPWIQSWVDSGNIVVLPTDEAPTKPRRGRQ